MREAGAMRSSVRTAGGRAAGAIGVAIVTAAMGLVGCQDMQPGGPGPVTGGYGYGYPPPPPPPRPMEQGFDAQAFAWSVNGGPGSIAGRIAYRSVSGEKWTCAGQTIALIPATAYSAERMQALYGSQGRAVVPAAEVQSRNAQRPGVDYGRYVRTATCDARDGFGFARLPVGAYFLIARARPHGHAVGPNEGVVIMQKLDIGPGVTHLMLPSG